MIVVNWLMMTDEKFRCSQVFMRLRANVGCACVCSLLIVCLSEIDGQREISVGHID